MPDVDIDFDDIGRDRVIEYVAKKYEKEELLKL
jgi:DNA polymerase III alpha subunit